MLYVIYIVIQVTGFSNRAWNWLICTTFYMSVTYAYLITKSNRTMADSWLRGVLFLTTATSISFHIDWPYLNEITGTIVHIITILTAIAGLIINRKAVLKGVKQYLKSNNMKKDRKKFKDTKAFGFIKGILPSAIDAIGIALPIPGLSLITNVINRQLNKDHVPVSDPVLTTELDAITPKGKRNWTTIVLTCSVTAVVLNAVASKYLGIEIPVQAIRELVTALLA